MTQIVSWITVLNLTVTILDDVIVNGNSFMIIQTLYIICIFILSVQGTLENLTTLASLYKIMLQTEQLFITIYEMNVIVSYIKHYNL